MNLYQITSEIEQKRITAIIGSVLYSSSGGGGSSVWGLITGILSNQTDLQNALNAKLNVANPAYTGTLTIGSLNYSDVNILSAFQASANNYVQIIIQNTSNGNIASSDLVISSDNGTATTHYLNAGKNSSGFTGSPVFSQAGYSYITSTSDDLAIGTTTSNAIHFVVNNANIDAFTINSSGSATFGSSFLVNGTAGNGYGEFIAQNSNASAPSNTGFRIFAGSNGSLNWRRKNGTDTFTRSFDSTLTADRTWTFLDRNGTIADLFPERTKTVALGRAVTAALSQYSVSTAATAANTVIVNAIIIDEVMTINAIIAEITTGTTGNFCLGIYADNGNGYPGAIVYDSGTIPVTGTVVYNISISPNLVLKPGVYWLAINTDTANTYRSVPSGSCPNVLSVSNTMGSGASASRITASSTFGALPLTYPAGGTITTGSPVQIGLQSI